VDAEFRSSWYFLPEVILVQPEALSPSFISSEGRAYGLGFTEAMLTMYLTRLHLCQGEDGPVKSGYK
jgi:hypothetical protein